MRDTHRKKTIGDYGERLAAEFLLKKGYVILVKNYRVRGGEIDLLAQQDDELVIVEVKTRTSVQYGWPEEAVNYHKYQHLVTAAHRWLGEQGSGLTLRQIRFDVIAIELDLMARTARFRHIKNIS